MPHLKCSILSPVRKEGTWKILECNHSRNKGTKCKAKVKVQVLDPKKMLHCKFVTQGVKNPKERPIYTINSQHPDIMKATSYKVISATVPHSCEPGPKYSCVGAEFRSLNGKDSVARQTDMTDLNYKSSNLKSLFKGEVDENQNLLTKIPKNPDLIRIF